MAYDPLQRAKGAAELLGSRGWARMNGRPEPEDADYDYCFFTNDSERLWEIKHLMEDIVRSYPGWTKHELPDGFLVISSDDIDIGVYPHVKREELIIAYKMRDAGISNEQMVLLLNLMQEARLQRRRT